MGPVLRLCLVLESTARAGAQWRSGAVLRHLIEPLLALAEAAPGGCELALVCFGAHAPHSAAAVDSCLGWWSGASVVQFRSHLLDSLSFAGGGGQPVALAEALLEAASLFACAAPGGGAASAGAAPTCQQHCLVFLASEPAPQPVPWPFAEDSCLASLSGLVTSAELCHTLRRRGVLLGLAGSPSLLSSSQQLWHVANLVSDVPLSLEAARWERIKRQQGPESVQQLLMRSVVSLPAGGGYAALPFWPQALEALQHQVGAKMLGAGPAASRAAGSLSLAGGDSLEPAAPAAEADESAAKRARTAAGRPAPPASGATGGTAVPMSAHAAAAAAPLAVQAATPPGAPTAPAVPTPLGAVVPSPEGPPVVQWTPPGTAAAQQATPPVEASPGSFWEVLNAEILSPTEAEALAVPVPAVQTPGYTPHEPAVQGLPLPPVQQARQAQQAPAQQRPTAPVQQPLMQAAPPMAQHAQHAQHAAQQAQQAQQPQMQATPGGGSMLGMPGGGSVLSGGSLPLASAASASSPASGVGGPHGKYAMVHSCRVVVDQKVTRSGTLLLGMGQVWGLQSEAAALGAVAWPQELHVVKTLAQHSAKSALANRPGCKQTRLRMTYSSAEAEAFPAHLLELGAVGVVALGGTALGVLFPIRHPQASQLVLNLVVVPNAKGG
ncbi:hypothetical protein ABPG75_012720 [Micractinium tetrahymenae]